MAWFCWHKWTPWKRYKVAATYFWAKNKLGVETYQHRTCTKCGKVQSEFICQGGWEDDDA